MAMLPPRSTGTAQVHHAARRRGGRVAVRGASAGDRQGRADRISRPLYLQRPVIDVYPSVPSLTGTVARPRFQRGAKSRCDLRAVDDARGLPAVAAELTRSQPELIVVSGTEAMLQSVLAANRAIPIVLIAVNFDPIARGYVNSLARPGGNITGVVFQQLELAEKQV